MCMPEFNNLIQLGEHRNLVHLKQKKDININKGFEPKIGQTVVRFDFSITSCEKTNLY